jgi:hypothetical protein
MRQRGGSSAHHLTSTIREPAINPRNPAPAQRQTCRDHSNPSRIQASVPVAAAITWLATGEDSRMPQFDATIKHIKEGVKGFTVSAAIKNIEGWETTLEKIETTGVKTIVKDLENLKKHLQADEIDSEQIRKLVIKLGRETVTLASREDGEKATKIKALGEALTHAAETAKAA